jgi:two-component system LytT family response regulator
MVSKNLTEMEELLKSSEFFRVHKTHLINKHHIQKVNKADGGTILMSNNESIPIARQRRMEFFDWLSR